MEPVLYTPTPTPTPIITCALSVSAGDTAGLSAALNTANDNYNWGGHDWISTAYQQAEAQYHSPR
jgi:hypothetical protein